MICIRRAACSLAAAGLVLGLTIAVGQAQPTATLPATAPATTQAALPTAQSVIDRYVEVTGGADAYASIRTRRAVGTFSLADLGITGQVTALVRRDGKARVSISIPDIGTVEQGMTDNVVWSIHPTDGPQILSGAEAAMTRRSFGIAPEASLDGYRDARVVDRVEINGRPAFKMELAVADTGAAETRYYDVESGLLVKSIGILQSKMGELPVTTFFTDYEDVVPIRMAMKIRQTMSGVSPEQAFTKVEHNVELPDTLFALPAEIVDLQRRAAATQPAPKP